MNVDHPARAQVEVGDRQRVLVRLLRHLALGAVAVHLRVERLEAHAARDGEPVAAADRAATIRYLRAREQVTMIYRECLRQVWLKSDHPVSALCYMVDRGHPQYAGRLDLATRLHLVRQGHGQSGANRDYVLSTVHALEALGLYDRDLHLLAERLRGPHEARAASS